MTWGGPQDDVLAFAAAVRPRAEDFPLVFLPPHDAIAWARYRTRADGPAFPRARRGQETVITVAAWPHNLLPGGVFAHRFPPEYQGIVARLRPDRVWIAWSFVESGKTEGTDGDGLVWLDGRWAWFPEPWKLLDVEPFEGRDAETG